MISLMARACLPVSRRTPMASCMTTMAMMAATPKTADPRPHSRPAVTATLVTVAEWLLGIPPSPNRRSRTNSLCMIIWIRIFRTCETAQAQAPVIRILFCKRSLKAFAIIFPFSNCRKIFF